MMIPSSKRAAIMKAGDRQISGGEVYRRSLRHRRTIGRGGEPWLGTKPVETVRHDAESRRREPEHRGTHEPGEGEPPETVHQREHRRDADVDPDGEIDAPLEIPAVGLHEIEVAALLPSLPRNRRAGAPAEPIA